MSPADSIAVMGRRLYERGFLRGLDSNISVRDKSGRIFITPSGLRKETLRPGQIIVLNPQGKRLSGGLNPSSEYRMHLACYRSREDVSAVLHAHPAYAAAAAISGLVGQIRRFDEARIVLGPVATIPKLDSGSSELARAVGAAARKSNVIALEWHGATILGRDLEETFLRLETFEWCCQVLVLRRGAGSPPAASLRSR